jgi:hypothetical protein
VEGQGETLSSFLVRLPVDVDMEGVRGWVIGRAIIKLKNEVTPPMHFALLFYLFLKYIDAASSFHFVLL